MTPSPYAESPAPHRVVALARPPQATFVLACASEVFGDHGPAVPARYAFEVCTERPGPVRTEAGYDLLVTAGLDALERADTVLVPGWQRSPGAEVPEAVVAAVRRAHERGARIVGLCSGAFVLAAAGLLDGRRAATHWARAAELAARFPRVRVDPAVLYVDHGDVATSAGGAAAVDLCLHLVSHDQGAAYALRIARQLVMPPHREGCQLQYAELPASGPVADSLAPLLEWLSGRLDQPVTVAEMAVRAQVSARTLTRRFTEQLGISPGRWLLDRRIAATRALLEETDLPVETIARRVGLSSAVNLRRRFHEALRTTPAAYRRAFRTRRAGQEDTAARTSATTTVPGAPARRSMSATS
ncbi:helix-turn-helix domain-containing protein [Streptomyces sp. SID8379]|uniref:GlxA family transcriptional regulator n=1 Tax=unclassified Streptomyces TaxID=2593676 RepID=UPI000360D9DC|nr:MULTISPECIES: helix-turn-helix domain-containing protein [unclassified Streptomyces]MYW62995.1 helix-turn-helix domain-containing protein [Streptomyces sp. SID8379]